MILMAASSAMRVDLHRAKVYKSIKVFAVSCAKPMLAMIKSVTISEVYP